MPLPRRAGSSLRSDFGRFSRSTGPGRGHCRPRSTSGRLRAAESVFAQGWEHTVDSRTACFKDTSPVSSVQRHPWWKKKFQGLPSASTISSISSASRPRHLRMLGCTFVGVIILAGVGGMARTRALRQAGGGFTAFDMGFAAFFVRGGPEPQGHKDTMGFLRRIRQALQPACDVGTGFCFASSEVQSPVSETRTARVKQTL